MKGSFEEFLQKWEKARRTTASYRVYLTLLTLWRMNPEEQQTVKDLLDEIRD